MLAAADDPSDKIESWRSALYPDQELRVVFGGHWDNNPEWLLLDESEQDISKPLNFPDNSVDVIFTEHVFEHVDFCSAVSFLHQSLRILKPGGVFRLVCPMLDSILSADFSGSEGISYTQTSLTPYYVREHLLLDKILGLGGLSAAPFDFFVNSMFREHGHKFIWSSDLVMRVMQKLGFSKIAKAAIGEGINPEYCIERRKRGIYLGDKWPDGSPVPPIFDLESTVVEAVK